MRLDGFTERPQEAILQAQERARGESHSQIEPSRLLLALLPQRDGLLSEMVRQLGGDPSLLIRTEQKIEVKLTDLAKRHLAEGYDPVYGARPLKRGIQRQLRRWQFGLSEERSTSGAGEV